MSQIPLSYPPKADYAAENFFVSTANEEAYQLVKTGEWGAAPGLYIYGETGCGKTHLSHLFDGIVIDDIEQYIANEEDLFHLLNRLREENKKLLCTAKKPPNQLNFKTKDVQSRLIGMLQVKIQAPDEALLKLLLAKQCADRQLKVSPDVINYIASRIERSYTAITEYIIKLDAYALSTRREITIPLARDVLLIPEISVLYREF